MSENGGSQHTIYLFGDQYTHCSPDPSINVKGPLSPSPLVVTVLTAALNMAHIDGTQAQ